MARHVITIPYGPGLDPVLGPSGEIVWDDEAGTVSGTHVELPAIRLAFDAPKPVTVGVAGYTWRLRDPAHEPAEFLVLLNRAHWPALHPPLRETLPAIFDGVQLPRGEPDEELFGGRGRRRI